VVAYRLDFSVPGNDNLGSNMSRLCFRCRAGPEKSQAWIDTNVSEMALDQTTSLSLLERVRLRNTAAWNKLCDLYLPMVIQWCRWGAVREDDISDISQEVFLAVSKYIDSFRRSEKGQSFRAWLRTITKHKIIDFARGRGDEAHAAGGSDAQRKLVDVPAIADESTDEQVISKENAILYARAMAIVVAEFPEWYRIAFTLLVIQERSPQEVADMVDKRVSAVYNVKARILRRLRTEFTELLM